MTMYGVIKMFHVLIMIASANRHLM